MLLQPGALIADRYRIERVLHTKPSGSVLAARARLDGSAVAIKIFPTSASSARLIKRFSRGQQINSPHVPKLLELGGIDETRTFIAMEYVEGESLKEIVARGPIPMRDALVAVRQACHAVATAHELGVVHRRLKTSKLLLAPGAGISVRVLGFMTSHSGADVTAGGVDYLSPEQLASSPNADATTADTWALGVITYELLTGRLPFSGMTQKAIAKRIQTDDPKPPRAVRGEVPWQLEQLVLRCLDRNPASRLSSVRELMESLEPFAREAPSTGPTATVSSRSSIPAASVLSQSQIVQKRNEERLPSGPRTPTDLPNVTNLRNIISSDETSAGQSAGLHRLGRDGNIEKVNFDEVARRRASGEIQGDDAPRRSKHPLRPSGAPPLSTTNAETGARGELNTQRLIVALIVGAALLGVGGGLLIRLLSR